jgi:hypothetical protein
MSRAAAVFLGLFLVGAGLQAQDYQVGVKAGANLTSYADFEEPFVGPSVALALEYKFNKIWGFQGGFQYTLRGYENRYTIPDFQPGEEPTETVALHVREKADLHFVNLVLRVKYYFNPRLNISTGLSLGNLVADDIRIEASSDDGQDYRERFSNNELRPNDVGLPLAIEYKLRNGLAFEAVYTLGFLSVYESGQETTSQTLQLHVQYYF